MLIIPPSNAPLNANHPLSRGLCGYWPLNEGAGKIISDITRRSLDVATPTFGSGTILTNESSRGNAAKFAGSAANDYIRIGKPSILNLQGEMSVAALFFATNVSSGNIYRYILSDYNSTAANAQFALQMTNLKNFTFFWANGGTQAPNPSSFKGTTTVLANTWYHIVAVRRGSAGAWSADLYVNGKLEATTSSVATNPATQANSGNVSIGTVGDYTGLALSMIGYLKDIAIWNRALNANEAKMLFENPYCIF